MPIEPEELRLGVADPNLYPFSYYLEPEGTLELSRLHGPGCGGINDDGKPKRNDYARLVPETSALALAMYANVPNRWRWGIQIQGKDRDWMMETYGEQISTGKEGCGRYCDPLYSINVVKALAGRTWAIGSNDFPYKPKSAKSLRIPHEASPVRYLRFDIDEDYRRDGHWWKLDDYDLSGGNVWLILQRLRALMSNLGLNYNVFRTGGRGIQLVIPLPSPTPHAAASVIAHGIWRVLQTVGGKDFQCNVLDDAILRMPGGLHLTGQQRLGLWIDDQAEQLYPINRQAQLMVSAWQFDLVKSSGDWSTYEHDIAVIGERVDNGKYVERDGLRIPTAHFVDLVTAESVMFDLAGLPLIQAIGGMMAGVSDKRAVPITSLPTVAAPVAESVLPIPESATPARSRSSRVSEAWALDLWKRGYHPGGFWDWFNLKGQKGLMAAVMVFGVDNAEEALIEQAQVVLPSNAKSLTDRIERIKSGVTWWRKHQNGKQVKQMAARSTWKLGGDDDEIQGLARFIVGQIPRGGHDRWNMDLAEGLCTLILIGLRDSSYRGFVLSERSACKEIERRWPNLPHSTLAVHTMFGVLERHGAFERITRRHTMGEGDAWGCGRLAISDFATRMNGKPELAQTQDSEVDYTTVL